MGARLRLRVVVQVTHDEEIKLLNTETEKSIFCCRMGPGEAYGVAMNVLLIAKG